MKHTFHARSIGNSLLIVIVAIIAVILQVLDKTFGNTFTISLGSIFPQADLYGLRFDGSNFHHDTICIN